MKNDEKIEAQDLLKVSISLLLSYLVPIIGMVFSIYVLSIFKRGHYDSWVKIMAIISFGIQLLIIFCLIIGWLTWTVN